MRISDWSSDVCSSDLADGTWTQRDSFVAIEVGTILALRSMLLPATPTGIVEKLEEFERRLPTQTVRSEEHISTQPFYTPLALAWLVSHLSSTADHDLVLEPSTSVGMLANTGRVPCSETAAPA